MTVKEIAQGLVASGVDVDELLVEVAREAKVGLTWKQREGYERKKVTDWERDGELYDCSVFPEFVKRGIGDTDAKMKREVLLFAKRRIRYSTKYGGEDNFAVRNGEAYFNRDGYRQLIMVSQGMGWMSNDQVKRWQRESGLFKEFEAMGVI